MLRDRKAKVPEAANTRLKALRGLFKWALADIDLATRFPTGINPARDVPSFRTYSTGHHTWTLEEVTQFETALIALDVCSRARSSSTCPTRTRTVMTAAASKSSKV
jgi:hypothetical protein